MGTLKLIGEGAKPVDFARAALEARSRSARGGQPRRRTDGLYFVKADYPIEEEDAGKMIFPAPQRYFAAIARPQHRRKKYRGGVGEIISPTSFLISPHPPHDTRRRSWR